MSSSQEEKLLKVFDQLGVSSPSVSKTTNSEGSNATPDALVGRSPLSRGDKLSCISTVCESLLSRSLLLQEGFHRHLAGGVRALIELADDQDHDVRIAADEAVNRLIKMLRQSYTHHLLYDLFSEVKRNGPARCLSSALRKFGDLAPHIKPSRGRMYAMSLLPVLEVVCQREEDLIQDALVEALPKIASNVLYYASEMEIKEKLLKILLPRLHTDSVTGRRSAAELIGIVCRHARQPLPLVNWVLEILVDILVPVDDEHPSATIHGVLLATRHLIICADKLGREHGPDAVRADLWPSILEIFLFHCRSPEPGLTTASLEGLVQLLATAPQPLVDRLRKAGGLPRTTIFTEDVQNSLRAERRASLPSSVDRNCLPQLSSIELESELAGPISVDAAMLAGLVIRESPDTPGTSTTEEDRAEESLYSEDADEELTLPSDTMDQPLDLDTGEGDTLAPPDLQLSSPMLAPAYAPEDPRVGHLTDAEEIPLLHLVRVLTARFLLAGSPGQVLRIRVSTQALALQALARASSLAPQVMLNTLFIKGADDEKGQLLTDVFLFADHEDPQLQGCTCLLIGDLLSACARQSCYRGAAHWMEALAEEEDLELEALPSVNGLVRRIQAVLLDKGGGASGLSTKLALQALRHCGVHLLASPDGHVILPVLESALGLAGHNYRLVRRELLLLIASLDYKAVFFVEQAQKTRCCVSRRTGLQSHALSTVLRLLGDSDPEVRRTAVNAICTLVGRLYRPGPDLALSTLQAGLREMLPTEAEVIGSGLTLPASLLPPALPGLNPPLAISPDDATKRADLDSETALHTLVNILIDKTLSAITPTDKSLLCGCIAALNSLVQRYPIAHYPLVWGATRLGPVHQKDNQSGGTTLPNQNEGSDDSQPWCEKSSLDTFLVHCLSLLTSSQSCIDIQLHIDLLHLTTQLIQGCTLYTLLHAPGALPKAEPAPSDLKLDENWPLTAHCTAYLRHLARLLSIFWHVIEDESPSPPSVPLPGLGNPALSPIKRKPRKEVDMSLNAAILKPKRDKDLFEKDNRPAKNKDSLGYFYSLIHYQRLYETIKVSYHSYKISADLGPDRTIHLLTCVLTSLGQLLEVLRFSEVSVHTEELLVYLTVVYAVESVASVQCVAKLLRAIFGTNLSSQWDEGLRDVYTRLLSAQASSVGPANSPTNDAPGRNCRPSLCLALSLPSLRLSSTLTSLVTLQEQLEGGPSPHRRDCHVNWLRVAGHKRAPAMLRTTNKPDRPNLGNYIRMFEPIVIRSLRHYSLTSCALLQSEILALLCQLVRLRVNYSQLDSEQRFLSLVLSQFDQFEQGQLRETARLAPPLFSFLLLLSHERAGGEPIVALPTLSRLAESLLASGVDPEKAVLPALGPLAADLFVHRTPGSGGVELEAQRECLLQCLLHRVGSYPGSLDLLALALHQTAGECLDRWKRLSRQIADALLPTLARGQVRIESREGLESLQRLLATMSGSVFRPIDAVLRVMFAPVDDRPPNADPPGVSLHRWTATQIALLRLCLLHCPEDTLLARLAALRPYVFISKRTFSERRSASLASSPDQEADQPPDVVLARFLFQLVGILSSRILENAQRPHSTRQDAFLREQLASLQLVLLHLFQSGQYRRITQASRQLISNMDAIRYYSVEDINSVMFDLGRLWPYLCVQWCQVLTRLGYQDQSWWDRLLDNSQPSCLNQEVLRRAAFVLSADQITDQSYEVEKLSWLLVHQCRDLIAQWHEPVVQDLLGAVHRNPSASGLFVQAFDTKCADPSPDVKKLRCALRCLEPLHLGTTGRLLRLLGNKFLTTHWLAVTRKADDMACRRVEMLLAMKKEECLKQLPMEDLDHLTSALSPALLTERFPILHALLGKLREHLDGTQEENSSSKEHEELGMPDMAWFTAHVALPSLRNPHQDPRLAPRLLQHLPQEGLYHALQDALRKDPPPRLLEQSLRLGFARTLARFTSVGLHHHGGPGAALFVPGSGEAKVDPLFQAAESVLLSELSVQCRSMDTKSHTSPCSDRTRTLQGLCIALNAYLTLVMHLPIPAQIPAESLPEICGFLVVCVQHLLDASRWLKTYDAVLLDASVNLLLSILKTQPLNEILASASYQEKVLQIVHLMCAALHAGLLPENGSISELPISSRDQMALLLNAALSGALEDQRWTLRYKIKMAILGLSRLPQFIWEARTPAALHPADPGEEPSLDLDSLARLDRDQLGLVASRLGLLGWTGRRMFEETWMALLAVLNRLPEDGEEPRPLAAEELVERSQCLVTGLRALTRLLVETMARPLPGNPLVSQPEHRPRDSVPNFLHTRLGRKLAAVHSMVEDEVHACLHQHRLSTSAPGEPSAWNLERESDIHGYGHGQVCAEVLAKRIEATSSSGREDIHEDLDVVSCLQSVPILHGQWLQISGEIPLSLRVGALQSAVILADLFSTREQFQWLMEAILEVGQQCDDELLESWLAIGLAKCAAALDLPLVALETATRWAEQALSSPLPPVQDAGLHAAMALLQARDFGGVGAARLHGEVLDYLEKAMVQWGPSPMVIQPTGGLPGVVGAAMSAAAASATQGMVAPASLQLYQESEHHKLTVLATVCFYCERHPDAMRETDLLSALVAWARQCVLSIGKEPSNQGSLDCSLALYLALFRGLERLVLTGRLPRITNEVLIKLSLDRLRWASSPVLSLPALGLFLTCVYSSLNYPSAPDSSQHQHSAGLFAGDPEAGLVALERVGRLLVRARTSVPSEARLLARLIPHLMLDFFPENQTLNKVIAEFLTGLHVCPTLPARMLYEVFSRLMATGNESLVREWVLLSLRTALDRTPLHLAVWSTTVFLLAASSNITLRATFHLCLSRLGRMEEQDIDLLCMSGVSFVSESLSEPGDRTAFLATIGHASATPFQRLHRLATATVEQLS